MSHTTSRGSFLLGISALALVVVSGCADSEMGLVSITLAPNQRMEETAAGWWIEALNLDYDNKYFFDEVGTELELKAELLDKYIEDGKRVKVWKLPVENFIASSEGKFVVINEYSDKDGDRWFVVRFTPPGITWTQILSSHLADNQIDLYQLEYLEKIKKKSNDLSAVITSQKENGARMFLYGWGGRCIKAVLL